MNQLNFIERVFEGESRLITYLVLGFVGIGFVGYLVLSFYALLGTFAENHHETISPVLVMYTGLLGLTAFGLMYSIWIWVGCWRYKSSSHPWLRYPILGLAFTHALIVFWLVFGLYEFNLLALENLTDQGRFILNF
jgi:hypothetical protein